ncbi:uncharacterized protein L3040_005478 [Drepanopeziza brunnea f. sp. 'multigermtubi']|uniref:uncharacterized protein n=1 Tax=Drepanopeziza brunnea f. sp. 'multigermtubi' TaxID=698441 RepID=UPI0023A50B91|nr:hypothetical protein L3040_005478 [Drepanopeziza brunnea f. sp. 'multigermtubi']
MSQAWSTEDPTSLWASLSVVKFSHLTSLYGRRCPPWTHISADNLSFVIQAARTVDDNGSYSQRVLMKVISGAETLEYQDLGRLVQLYRQADPSTEPENMVEVMANSPRMAMRYPQSFDSVRKIQVRFQNDADCTKAMNIMKELGLPIKAPVLPVARPGPSPSPSMLSSSSIQSNSSLAPPPRSVSTMSTLSNDRSFGLPSSSPYFGFKVPERPATAETGRKLPDFHASESRPVPDLVLTPNTPGYRPSSSRESANNLYLSQLERESQSRRMSQPVSQPFGHLSNSSDQFSSMFPGQTQAQSQKLAELAEAKSRLISSSSFSPSPSTATRSLDQGLANPFWAPPNSQRPSSTPAESYDLPPRRVLPFDPSRRLSSAVDLPALPKPTPVSKPGARMATSNENPSDPEPMLASKPSPKKVANEEKSQVPKPAPMSALACSPKKATHSKETPVPIPVPATKRVAQRKAPTAKPPAKPAAIANTDDHSPIRPTTQETVFTPPVPHEDEPSPLAAKSAAAAAAAASARPASAASGLISKANAPARKRTPGPVRPASNNKRPKMVNASTQTQEAPTIQERVKEKGPDMAPSDLAPPNTFLNEIDAFLTKHKARPPPKELWKIPAYQEASEEDRHMMINDFICENLENPDFLQLCEDMETAWRRIGLGM